MEEDYNNNEFNNNYFITYTDKWYIEFEVREEDLKVDVHISAHVILNQCDKILKWKNHEIKVSSVK